MMSAPRPASNRWRAAGRGLARVALGLFILGQIVFLLFAAFRDVEGRLKSLALELPGGRNLAPAWFDGEGRVADSLQYADRHARRYAQLTGQEQHWSLFAPDVAAVIPFPVVELRWDGPDGGPAPVLLPSPNLPADPANYFKVGHFRLRRYEDVVTPVPSVGDNGFEPNDPFWRDALANHVRENRGHILAYLRVRLRQYQDAHPGAPTPTAVLLSVRAYHVPAPPGPTPYRLTDLGEHPVCRWHPCGTPADETPALHVFDPVAGVYDPPER